MSTYLQLHKLDSGAVLLEIRVSNRCPLKAFCLQVIDKQTSVEEWRSCTGIVRATKGFHAKFCADGRTYSYTTPTYAFANAEDVCRSYRISSGMNTIVQSLKRFVVANSAVLYAVQAFLTCVNRPNQSSCFQKVLLLHCVQGRTQGDLGLNLPPLSLIFYKNL